MQGQVLLQKKHGREMTEAPLHELLLRYDLRGPESPGMWEPNSNGCCRRHSG